MAAKLHFLPYQVATVTGIAQPGAKQYFYQTGTLTKLPIYTTDLLDVQLSNPVIATGAGRFPDIYLDDTQTYRLVVKNKNDVELDDIDPYIPGTVEGLVVGNDSATANTRGELAAMIGGTGSNAIAFLSEPGREGMFAWTIGDQSAYVTADTAQGVFVAPAVDTTGASGAWVRKFTGPIYPEWFGAVGDDTTNDAAAFAAMENYRIAVRKAGTEYGYSYGSVAVCLSPSRAYYLGTGTSSGVVGQNAGWNVYTTVHIDTPNGAGPSGLSSIIRVAAATSGVIFHSSVSAGVNGFTTDRGYSAAGSVARGLAVVGGFSSTESEHHGIHFRIKVTLIDSWADNFPGDGIYGNSFSYDGIHDDNINGSSIVNPFVRGNRHGIYINYNDANAIALTNPQPFTNRLYGVFYENCVNINIYGGNGASNGSVVGFPTQVYNNGHVFGCLPGQETWCSTNSPPATATNNMGWYYLTDAGAATTSRPQWVSGTTYRSGGPIRVGGTGSAEGGIFFHESESDQMPILITGGSKVLICGGANFGIIAIDQTGTAYGGCIAADSSGLQTGTVVPNITNNYTLGIPSKRFSTSYIYNLDALSSVLCAGSGGFGYATGAGAAVTQLTSKSTAPPAINKSCGAITMNNAALAAGAKVSFAVSNSLIAATDTVIVSVASGGTANAYRAAVTAVASTSFTVTVENITAGSLSEAPVINFSVIKAVAA